MPGKGHVSSSTERKLNPTLNPYLFCSEEKE
jgi:hypothetical protein